MSDRPEEGPDQCPGLPHPKETATLFGQQAAEQRFRHAAETGRMHHAWLLSGPSGVGKATLAYRLAHAVLAGDISAGRWQLAASPQGEDPVLRRIHAGSEPGLLSLTRPWDEDRKRFKRDITIDEMRKLQRFFGLSAAGGGARAVIIDAADELNIAAANALLKSLEEPPAKAVIFLIAHYPGRLLPTIRSRCRVLPCGPLTREDLSAALHQAGLRFSDEAEQQAVLSLAQGSVGQAARLHQAGAAKLYPELAEALVAPRFATGALCEVAKGETLEARADLLIYLLQILSHRAARRAVQPALAHAEDEVFEGEAARLAAFLPDPVVARRFAMKLPEIVAQLQHGRAVNLDPQALILDMLGAAREARA